MHHAYRSLLERLEATLSALPELLPLWKEVELLDDLDPLRVPALKAMKRVPAPPVELSFSRDGDRFVMNARNLLRKREAKTPTRCAALQVPSWLWDTDASVPAGLTLVIRRDCAELVRTSFELFATRIRNHFTVSFGQQLVVRTLAPAPLLVLVPAPGPLAGLSPQSPVRVESSARSAPQDLHSR